MECETGTGYSPYDPFVPHQMARRNFSSCRQSRSPKKKKKKKKKKDGQVGTKLAGAKTKLAG